MPDVVSIPLIIRGRIIEDDPVEFRGRRGGYAFATPDVNRHFDEIVLKNPSAIRDLYALSMDDILDYLEELGARLSLQTNPWMRQAYEASIAVSGMSPEILAFMYESQKDAVAKPRLREMINAVFGKPYLEQWVTEQRNDRTIRVRAFGSRMVHINAGNAMVIALQSIMNTALLRGDAIIKSPSNDPLTAAAIARTMIDMAPDHPITRHITVCYWKGGDDEFEKRLYRASHIEKIIAWGGTASMQHIRGHLGPGIDLIALDPKISCSLIGREAFESEATMRHVASLLARDIGYFNQEGCGNSRVTFVESGTGKEGLANINRLGEILYQEMLLLPSQFSSNIQPGFSSVLRDEISGIRYSPSFKVVGCRADEGGVIVSQDSEVVDFAGYLSGRVANLVPVDHIEDAYGGITIHTQTVSIYPDSLKDKVRDECAWHGAQRLTSLGCSTCPSFSQPHDGMEPLRRMARWLVIEDFDEAQFGSSGIFFGGY